MTMTKRKADATGRHGAPQTRDLTAVQLAAVPLLTAGATDAEVAEKLNLDRGTVYRWRRFSPTFQAAVNEARAETGRVLGDKIRAAAMEALDTILELAKSGDPATRLKSALAILDRCPMMTASGPSDPADIVAAEEARRRRLAPDKTDELLTQLQGDEGIDAARCRLFNELEELAAA